MLLNLLRQRSNLPIGIHMPLGLCVLGAFDLCNDQVDSLTQQFFALSSCLLVVHVAF